MSETANNTSKKRKKLLIELLPEIVRKGKQKAEQMIARANLSLVMMISLFSLTELKIYGFRRQN